MASAGGFFYHLRALHAAKVGWEPFRHGVHRFLERWEPARSLVIVGPSAGYCLTDAFLARFDDVTAIEPDPVARWLLGRRFRRLGLRAPRFISEDLVVLPLVHGRPALDDYLRASPGASILFSNLLGQICHLLDDAAFSVWQSQWSIRVAPALESRPWASFHDRVSSNVAPRLQVPHAAPERLDDQAVRRLYGHHRGPVELFDHGTSALFPMDRPHEYFHWELERGAHHLIEAVSRSTQG